MAGPRGIHAQLACRKSRGGQAEAGRGEDTARKLPARATPYRAVHVARVVAGWRASANGSHDLRRHRWFQSSQRQYRLAAAIRQSAAASATADPTAILSRAASRDAYDRSSTRDVRSTCCSASRAQSASSTNPARAATADDVLRVPAGSTKICADFCTSISNPHATAQAHDQRDVRSPTASRQPRKRASAPAESHYPTRSANVVAVNLLPPLGATRRGEGPTTDAS